LPLWLEIAYIRPLGAVWGRISQIWSPIVLTPKGPYLGGNTSFEPLSVKIGPAVRPGRRIEKKGKDMTGQDRTVKSQGGNISPIWGEAPTALIETKICMVGYLAELITCAKFQRDIFRGYNFTGVRISHFPIDFCMGLTTVRCL